MVQVSKLNLHESKTPMDSDVLIKVEGVGKKFCRDLKKSLWYGAKDIVAELVPGKKDSERHSNLRPQEFWAVDDVSFELRRGECLGLIGRNGAGKTTLLKMLNGLIKPDKGRIEMHGRVGALIALGAGFNPILTGRENIYVNASVLGLSKREIDDKLDDIIDFAEINEFIDSPVQTYSSGMQVRLGFAVATALEPDVLLLDEVLAVGDICFRTKCYHRIGELLKRCAVVYVSHDINQITRICSSVITLARGKVSFHGESIEGMSHYLNDLESKSFDNNTGGLEVWKKGISIENFVLDPSEILTGQSVNVHIRYRSDETFAIGALRCNLKTLSGVLAGVYNSNDADRQFEIKKGTDELVIELGPLPLCGGTYIFSLGAWDSTQKQALFHAYDYVHLKVLGNAVTNAVIEMGIINNLRSLMTTDEELV